MGHWQRHPLPFAKRHWWESHRIMCSRNFVSMACFDPWTMQITVIRHLHFTCTFDNKQKKKTLDWNRTPERYFSQWVNTEGLIDNIIFGKKKMYGVPCGCGRQDGEEIERKWKNNGPSSFSSSFWTSIQGCSCRVSKFERRQKHSRKRTQDGCRTTHIQNSRKLTMPARLPSIIDRKPITHISIVPLSSIREQATKSDRKKMFLCYHYRVTHALTHASFFALLSPPMGTLLGTRACPQENWGPWFVVAQVNISRTKK